MQEPSQNTPTDNPPYGSETEGVKTLLGDPKKAIIKLSFPMIIAMSMQTIYLLVDAFWVSGLGPDALAAVGFFFPFFMMAMGIATGLGVGGGAAISRMIGAKDREGADNVTVHTIVIMLILGLVLTLPFFIFAEDIFLIIGAGGVIGLVLSYARIMFAGILLIFFANIGNAILRSEGDAKRAMYAMILGAVLNIVFDPIFIYVLGLGIAGAAWASMASLGITAAIIFYWLFMKKDTFVSIRFRGFRFDGKILRDIFKVGLPAMIQHLSMSLTMLIMILIIVRVGGTDGVAVYSTGWRIATLAIMPLLGIATAVTPVTGAAFGSRDFRKLDIAYVYAIKIGLLIELVVAAATFILAPQITAAFTQAEEGPRIADDLILFLRITCIFYPMVSFGMFSSAMFQGTGKGMSALIATILRTLILTVPLVFVFGISLNMGLAGVWWGLVTGNILGSLVAFTWGRLYVRRMKESQSHN